MKEQRPWTINKDRQHIYRTVYNTQRWKKLRAMFLQSNPICIRCKEYGIITKALVVDHIIPIRKGGNAWSIDNLQPLCEKCHQVKTNQDIHKHTKQ